MGRSGNALVFLLPSESAYIQYLNISQNITLSVLPDTVNEDDIHHVLESTMAMLCKDRLVFVFCYCKVYKHISTCGTLYAVCRICALMLLLACAIIY